MTSLRVLIVIALAVSSWSAANAIRRPHDAPSYGDYAELTSAAVMYASNWWREGPWRSGFAQIETPLSAEVPDDLAVRGVYPSYPGFHLMPLYGLAVLQGQEPSHEMASAAMRALHLVIVLATALLALGLAGALGAGPAAVVLAGASAAGLAALAPGMVYFLQALYFPDVVVLTLVLLASGAELLRDKARDAGAHARARGMGWSVAILLFAGILTEYYALAFAGALVLKRVGLDRGGLRAGASVLVPALAALAVHAAQLAHWGERPLAYFMRRFVERGIETSSRDVLSTYFTESVPRFFGATDGVAPFFVAALGLVFLASAFAAFRRRRGPVAAAAALLVAPPLIYTVALRQYALNHDFTVMKFVPALAIAPALLAFAVGKGARTAAVLAVAVAAGVAAMPWSYRVERTALLNREEIEDRVALGALVKQHVRFEDLLVSRLSPTARVYSGLDPRLPHLMKPALGVTSVAHLCRDQTRLGVRGYVYYFEGRRAPLEASLAALADRTLTRGSSRIFRLDPVRLAHACIALDFVTPERLAAVAAPSDRLE